MRTKLAVRAGVVALAVAGLAACGPENVATPPPSPPPPSPMAPAVPAPPPVPDGRYPAYLTALDSPAHTVTYDVVDLLTGDAAKKAWDRDHPEDPHGPYNDYYLLNEDRTTRTLPVAGNIPVQVMDIHSPNGITPVRMDFAGLPRYLATNPMPETGTLWPRPFWLVVEGGKITALEEQFLP